VTAATTMLKRALRQGGVSTGLIKGDASSEPLPGYVPGYSASGQDIWLPKATHFGPGLVLSAVGARCGKVFLADGEWSVVANTVVLTPQPGHDPKFLWYLTNYEGFWEKGGTAQPYVRVPETLARHVWLPSLAEQRVIADYLDAETARIDSLIAKKQQLIDLLEERVWSYRTRVLLGLVDPHSATVDSPRLGTVSADRSVVQLKRLVPGIGVGLVINPSTYFANTGVPFIHGSNVRDGWIDQSMMKFMSPADSLRLPASRVRSGDVVVVRAGYPGRAAVIDDGLDGAQCASILILRRSAAVLPEYLAAFFNSGVARSQIEAYQYGAAQEQVNVGHVVEFLVPIVEPRKQAQCVAMIREADVAVGRVTRHLTAQIALLVEHRQAVITAAVTGAFDVR